MRLHAAAALALAAITGADAAGITEVTTRTFEAETSKGDPLLLVFYAPWCGHCRRLEPTLHQLAASSGDAYSIAKVDGTAHRVLTQRFGVRGFPSLFYVRSKQQVLLYEGSRGFAELDEWLRRGYTQSPRLSLLKSPFGPIGRAKGWCSAAGLAALDVYEALSEKIGSWAAAAAVVVLGLVLMVLVFVGPLLYLA